MGIWTKVFGGRVVKRVVERYWGTAKEARKYLEEFGVPKTVSGTHFEFEHYQFSLSHTIEDIRANDELPDNSISMAMRPRSNGRVYIMPKKAHQEDEARLLSGAVTGTPDTSYPKPSGIKRPVIQGKVVVLKEICRDLKMEPRVARVILRKKLKDRDPNSRWEWSADEAEKIKDILKAGA